MPNGTMENTEMVTCADCVGYGHCILQKHYGVLLCQYICADEVKE